MTIETATYISDLNATYPAASDPKSEGDDHLRLIKSTVKATFPNVAGVVTPTHTQLNYVSGVTSAIQTQLDAKAPTASPALTGTPTAPTASPGTNTTQLATTGFVATSFAPLASPAFTGTPTAPTATAGTSTTQLATTAFVSATAFSAALPSQTGNAGRLVTTDGTNASWTTLAAANIAATNAANTFTAQQTLSGSTSVLAAALTNAAETATVSATAATGTINYDITTQSVLYYTSNASANWTVNFRASSGTSLNTALATGQSVTVAFLVTQGSTAYYNSSVQVDGTTSGVTTRWIGGAPTAGNASGIDSYRYVIIKTASATFTVLASVNQFKA